MEKIEIMVTEYWATSLDHLIKEPFRVGAISAVNPIHQAKVNQAMKLMSKLNTRILYPPPINIEPLRKTETLKILNTETQTLEE